MSIKIRLLSISLLGIFTSSFGQSGSGESVPGTGLSFVPDVTLVSSSLEGWQKFGGADWTVKQGLFTGTKDSTERAGLLLLNRSYQDVAIRTLFRASADAEIGFVFRIEKNNNGMKGILVSSKDGELASYRISLDGQGKELNREKLRHAGSIVRSAPPADPSAVAPNRPRRQAPLLDLPLKRPGTDWKPGDWNQIEVFMDSNIIRSFLNDGSETAGGATEDTDSDFGPFALFMGGKGKVEFKDLGYKDVALRVMPVEASSPRFNVQRINDMYFSWASGAGDFNKDGDKDIVAGPWIYFGPDYTKSREIYPAIPFNPSREFTDVNCQYTFDFNGDGWDDILSGPPRSFLYLNPKGESRRWKKYEVVPGIQSEITVFRDIDGDGKPELVYASDGSLRYAKPDPQDPTKPWTQYKISEQGYGMGHGIGVGDINGDGRMDIINPNGWWEQPEAGKAQGLWIYHPEAFARFGHRNGGAGGAVMAVYDVNGDGLNDVVTGLNAHGFGLAWFEQKKGQGGKSVFTRHMISDDYSTKNAGDVTISQLHGSSFADVDGDGITDFIVGKRYWSHLDNFFDPDPYGPPVIYLYRTVRNPKAPGGAEFVPELIHNRSGAGSDILVTDLDKDGRIDIVSSTDRGTFIYWNKSKNKSKVGEK